MRHTPCRSVFPGVIQCVKFYIQNKPPILVVFSPFAMCGVCAVCLPQCVLASARAVNSLSFPIVSEYGLSLQDCIFLQADIFLAIMEKIDTLELFSDFKIEM